MVADGGAYLALIAEGSIGEMVVAAAGPFPANGRSEGWKWGAGTANPAEAGSFCAGVYN